MGICEKGKSMIVLKQNEQEFAVDKKEFIRMLYCMERNVPEFKVSKEDEDWIVPFLKEDSELMNFANSDFVLETGTLEKFLNYPIGVFSGAIYESDGLETDDYFYFELLVGNKSVILSLTTVGICLYAMLENEEYSGEIPQSLWWNIHLLSVDFDEYYSFSPLRKNDIL